MLIVIGVLMGIAIAGMPSARHDTPLHLLTTTTGSPPSTTALP
jgi:hypothetical protein